MHAEFAGLMNCSANHATSASCNVCLKKCAFDIIGEISHEAMPRPANRSHGIFDVPSNWLHTHHNPTDWRPKGSSLLPTQHHDVGRLILSVQNVIPRLDRRHQPVPPVVMVPDRELHHLTDQQPAAGRVVDPLVSLASKHARNSSCVTCNGRRRLLR